MLREASPPSRKHRSKKITLTPPLKPDSIIRLKFGRTVRGADIIGQQIRSRICDSGNRRSIILEASLGTYVTHTRRSVTPLYPKHCAIITSLLDISLPCPGEDPQFDQGPPFEILEAGTGHGALTLHLAREIHGANPPIPARIRDDLVTAEYTKGRPVRTQAGAGLENIDSEPGEDEESQNVADAQDTAENCTGESKVPTETVEPEKEIWQLENETNPETCTPAESPVDAKEPHPISLELTSREILERYLSTRRAIIHTFDINRAYQRQAHQHIRHFKRALYFPSIEFHIGDLRKYLKGRLKNSDSVPFLSHCILDLPDPLRAGATQEITKSLLPGGILLVFNPNITQIADVVAAIEEDNATLRLERVVELDTETYGPGESFMGDADVGGGKDWVIKAVKPKGLEDKRWKYICRPKYGTAVCAGGFVGLFRKFHFSEASSSQSETQASEEEVEDPGENEGSETEPEHNLGKLLPVLPEMSGVYGINRSPRSLALVKLLP